MFTLTNCGKRKMNHCNIPAISLSDAEYKAIPSGGNMTSPTMNVFN